MKIVGLWIFLMAALLLKPPLVSAYMDDVKGVTAEEAWQATLKVLGTKGVQKADKNKKFIQSRWVEDEVVRRNSLFKDVTSQDYLRRSRMKISFNELPDRVEIKITGSFEEKPKQSPPQAPWRKLKTRVEDYELEHALFMRILTQLAKDHG